MIRIFVIFVNKGRLPINLGKYLLLLLLFNIFITHNIFANNITSNSRIEEISDLFIEATGNNKYEAKIKAHEIGMFRALSLVIDRMGIENHGIGKISYYELSTVFTPINITNEFSSKEQYSATVTYQYQSGQIYKLLLNHGSTTVDNMFYEYLVIPVFKQNNKYTIWKKKRKWQKLWDEARELLEDRKIFYPENSLILSQKITSDNIMKLDYNEFIDIFPEHLFKKVMIVSSELLTNRENRESYVDVKKFILSPEEQKPTILAEQYNIETIKDISDVMDMLIDQVIYDFGKNRYYYEFDLDEEFIDAELNLDQQKEKKTILMYFEVFDQDELDLVVNKLEEVAEIDHFIIKHDYDNKYKFLIYTYYSEYDLAKGLYLSGLSYRIHGGKIYNLIDIAKGG